MAALLIAALPAVGLPVLLSPAADAVLTGVGPVDPDTRFPAYYTDSSGLSLQPCLDGLPLCPTSFAEAIDPVGGGEGFYSMVSADAGGISLGLDMELAYLSSEPDQEVVFARTQYSARNTLEPGRSYTVTDPYGTRSCTADGTGSIKNNACRLDQIGGPQDFVSVLKSRIGPFLTWDTLGAPTGGPPAGYVGDGATPHPITGSPTGFNMFRVQGPGISSTCLDTDGVTEIPNCDETDLFVVSGKIAEGVSSRLDASEHDFGNQSGEVTQDFTYSAIGTANSDVTSVTVDGDFSETDDCGTVNPGDACTISVTFTPVPGHRSEGTLTIVDNTPNAGRSIPLTGRSLPVSAVNTDALSFGQQRLVAGPTAQRSVTVSNDGAAPMTVTGADADTLAFAADTSGCASPVDVGQSCTVDVAFDPATTGDQSGTVTIRTDGGDQAVSVDGTGVASEIKAGGLSFGRTGVGRVGHQVLVVTNTGTSPLTLDDPVLTGANAGLYDLEAAATDRCTHAVPVSVGDSCRIGVAFRPASLGSKPATLVLHSDDDGTRSVTVSGTGIDVTAPTVVARTPAPDTTAAARATNVVVAFSENITGVRASTFVLTNLASGRSVGAVVGSTSAKRYVLNPRTTLPARTRFRVSLVGGPSTIRDTNGVALRGVSWTFRTG